MRYTLPLLLLAVLTLIVDWPAGGQSPQRGRTDQPNSEPGRFRPPSPPLMQALDTNRDGQLSADEIKNSPKNLMSLDTNSDGMLSADEVRPRFGGGPPGFGPPNGPRSRPALSPEKVVERWMTLDKNRDGQLSEAEIPQRMHGLVTRADADHDGILTREELLKDARDDAGGR
ncbi:MAG TPA: hypothetical protein VHV55_07435 [Pirellulales bacterium]|jgi:Ca2+-binding EF-hand superfamily protein|nr:hypothetical protein [Pirellulales bacterium]